MKDEMFSFYKESLQGGGIAQPLCDEYKGMWRACGHDKEKLVRLVLTCQSAPYFATFCYRGKGLTKEYCKRVFKDYINGVVFHDCDEVEGVTYAIYIDPKEEVVLGVNVAQFLWCSDVNVTIQETKCPRLYVSNHSTLHLTLGGYNAPTIYLFDDSKVVIDDASEDSRILVYKYSNDAEVICGKYCLIEPKVFQKELRL